ncbi:hypothetical protein CCAX7_51610 [Capsulimonas corticalis]|uniref:Uncharacterized protein n=1 Tax=Capsulimonas corticalis TaxID=2219043 RepID=A0A402CPB1_9BACT|nr:acyltransferase [Capsulimonas corticalis]BDI33110.1 hypothetical protein CCAX7_51610 [Capsulimonas corticalis]
METALPSDISASYPADANSSSAKSRPRVLYLDGLRAVAALYVLIHHCLYQYSNANIYLGIERVLAGVFCFGHYGVCIFIVLSGFCLIMPTLHRDFVLHGGLTAFFTKRARRLLPPYYCSLILTIVLIATVIGHRTGMRWDVCLPLTAKSIVTHILLIHNLFGDMFYRLNYVYWSLAVEWQIYPLFPVLLLGWRRIGPGKTLGILATLVTVVFVATRHSSLQGLMPQFWLLFGLGMLAASIAYGSGDRWLNLRAKAPWGALALISTALLILISVVKIKHGFGAQATDFDFIVGAWAFSLLVYISLAQDHPLRIALQWRPLVFVGEFSYSLYLLHAPLIQILLLYVLKPLGLSQTTNGWLLTILALLICLPLSYLFFLAFERPFITKKTLGRTRPATEGHPDRAESAG